MPQRIDKTLMMLSCIIAPVTRKGAGCFLGGLHREFFGELLADFDRVEVNQAATFNIWQYAFGLLVPQPAQTWAAIGIRPDGL